MEVGNDRSHIRAADPRDLLLRPGPELRPRSEDLRDPDDHRVRRGHRRPHLPLEDDGRRRDRADLPRDVPAAPGDERPRELLVRKWFPIVILASAQFVMTLDSSVMNVSISQI